MKKITQSIRKTGAVLLMISAVTGIAKAQTNTQNYVITQTPRIAGIVNDSTMAANNGDKTKVQIALQYVDGLGRPIQTIQKQASPLGYDMIQPMAYDQYGRTITKYLPFTPQTGTAGSYRPNAVSTDQGAFFTTPPSGSGVTAITDPYAQTSFESSSLGRTLEQGAPGIPWQLTGVTGGGHTVKMVYRLNNDTLFTTDSVKGRRVANYYATINSDYSRTLHNNGYYPAGSLTVTISKDENWTNGRGGNVEEYKDIDGRVILKRVYNYTTAGGLQLLSTYYVYDDLGKLAFVLPPLSGADGAGAIIQTTLNNLCYQYQYDDLYRPVQKKVPGKGWEYTVYNTLDQPVATQDSLQRFNKQWIFLKYDALQRPVVTGIWNNGGTAITRTALQTTLNGISTNLYEAPVNTGNGYTTVAWPTTSVTATLSTNFYDTYANIPSLPATYTVSSGVSLLTRGMPTVKKTAVLNTPTDQLWDVIYCDDLGRTIKSYAQHYLGGTANTNNYDLATITYNFTNAPTTTLRKHYNTNSTTIPLVTIANTYIYDQVGRKLKNWEQITNGSNTPDPATRTLISKIDYNEIGQTITKHLHSTVDSVNSTGFLQNIAYAYNERGWMLTSSAPLFAMQLYYNTAGGNKAWNGNIMYQYWGTPGSLSTYFAYTYDRLNRITYGSTNEVNVNRETSINYDLMGNLTGLQRYQAGTWIDGLTYTYTSGGNATNQLQSIVDNSGSNAGLVNGTTTYSYDGNGNLLSNTNTVNSGQNKTFTYNLLNLPQTVSGSAAITYVYDAAGNKLRKVSTTLNNKTDYISGIQYDGATTPSLSFIQTEEGKAVPNGTGYDYIYYLGDNLGNTRVTFGTKTGVAVSYQKDDYMPFGMEINRSVLSPKNEYLYNKKELQEETQEYDYGARFYDPVIARWNAIDPLAEKSRRWSPYNYVLNNPIRLIDPDGMETQATNGGADFMHDFVSGTMGKELDGPIPASTDTKIQNGSSANAAATAALTNPDGPKSAQEKTNANLNKKIASDAVGAINAAVGADQSGPMMFPTSPNVFVFRERDNFIHTNIFYSENYIQLDIFKGAYRSEHVQINSINIWIPNGSLLQSQTMDKKISYLSVSIALLVDDIREKVNTKWINGGLRGANSMESEFKREFRAVIEMSFPGVKMDFKPRFPTWTPSVILHNIL